MYKINKNTKGVHQLKNNDISQILISDENEREQKIHDLVKDRRSLNINIELWGIINTALILKKPFDPYPYVFLNLILACLSSIQAPIIMMSQNREAEKDRLRAENEYLINQKSEIILEDLHMKIDNIINRQHILENEVNKLMSLTEAMRKEIVPGRDKNG